MLKKLLKYDYRSTRRTIWPLMLAMSSAILLATLSMTFMIRLVEETILPNVNDAFRTLLCVFLVTVTMILVIGFLAGMIACSILLIVRYFQDIATDTAYLTFTLPVPPTLQLISKLIISYFWMVLVSLLYLCGIAVFALVGTASSGIVNRELIDFIGQYGPQLWHGLMQGGAGTLIVTILYVIISPLCSFITMYFAVTVAGICFRRARVILSIGIIYAVVAIQSLLQQIASFMFTIPQIAMKGIESIETYMQMTTATLAIQLLISIVVAAALFLWSCNLLNKRLNLQ